MPGSLEIIGRRLCRCVAMGLPAHSIAFQFDGRRKHSPFFDIPQIPQTHWKEGISQNKRSFFQPRFAHGAAATSAGTALQRPKTTET